MLITTIYIEHNREIIIDKATAVTYISNIWNKILNMLDSDCSGVH